MSLSGRDHVVVYSNGNETFARTYYLYDTLGLLVLPHDEARAYLTGIGGFSNSEAKAYLNSLPMEVRQTALREPTRH